MRLTDPASVSIASHVIAADNIILMMTIFCIYNSSEELGTRNAMQSIRNEIR